jgi:pectate lyase
MSGQVLFSDDFETSDAAEWFPSADADAWSVVMDDTNVYQQAPPEVNSDRFSAAGDASWTDVSVEARVKVISFNGSSSSYFAGVYARIQSASNYYSFALRSDGKVSIRKTSSNLGSSVDAGIVEGEWFDVRFVVRGSTLTGYVNGTQIATVTDSSIPSGAIGVGTRNTSAMFDDVVVSVP